MVKLRSSKPLLWVRIPLPLCVPLMWLLWCKGFNFFRKIVEQNKQFSTLLYIFIDWVLISLHITKIDNVKSDNNILYSSKINFFLNNGTQFWIDFFNVYFFNKLFKFGQTNKHYFNLNIKTNQFNNNQFYFFNGSNTFYSSLQLFMYGLKSIWKHIRLWILPIMILFMYIYYSFFLKSLPFSKIIFGYVLLGNMIYLFLSGFVFFFKKYQYRLYTSVIQRFWRRTLIIFWVIEGSLFIIFVYLIFNANQEPVYVYDNIQIYKTHFYSWRYFLVKVILSSLLILLTYMLLLSLKWNTFTKTNNISFFITIILLYIAWLEFYQLFHLMNCYGTVNWIYDFSEHLWNLELEFKRTRIVNHYVTIGLVAKFWHIVFAVVFWIFFLLRGVESSRYRYPLLSANLQNFIIVYVMSWLYMYPWFKYVARKTLDMPYFWFFVNNRKLGVFLFFNDIKLYYWGLVDYVNYSTIFNFLYKNNSYFYWHESSSMIGNTQFRKHNIRDLFIRNIY